MGLEDDYVRLSAEDEIRFENLFGNLGDPDESLPLTPEEQARYNALFGDFQPGEAAFQLSAEEEFRFQCLFGNVFETEPVFGIPVNSADLIAPDLKEELISILLELKQQIEASDDGKGSDLWEI